MYFANMFLRMTGKKTGRKKRPPIRHFISFLILKDESHGEVAPDGSPLQGDEASDEASHSGLVREIAPCLLKNTVIDFVNSSPFIILFSLARRRRIVA